jgi:hypothetical protein
MSVVVPLIQPREADLDGVVAWTRQTVPAGHVEVVTVSADEVPRDAEARRVLRDGDQLVVVRGVSETGLWDAGARAARGDILVLTKCHSIPQAGCLSAALVALGAGLDVACFESRAPDLTSVAWLEAVFQNLFERRVDTGDPRALSLRGIALSRELYLRLGGLQFRRPQMLRRARVRGAPDEHGGAHRARLGGAVVEHIPNTRLRDLRRDNLDFHRDAVGACLADAASEVDPDVHLEMTPEWDTRARFDAMLKRAALPGLARLALRSGPAAYSPRRALPGMMARTAGPQVAAWVAELRSRFVMAL